MKKIIALIVIVCALLAGSVLLYERSATDGAGPSTATSTSADAPSTNSSPSAIYTPYVPRTPPQGSAEYHSQPYHFSIFYPSGTQYKEEVRAENTSLLVVFQDPSSGKGFQIYVQPYDLPTITPERFKLDEPSGVENDPVNVTIDGSPGIMFESTDPVIGNIREIWFIRDGLLYEVTTALTFDAWMQNIMQTWQFI